MNDLLRETTMSRKRPLIVTIVCIVGFVGALVAMPLALSPQSQAIGAWYPPVLLSSAVAGCACFAGLWMMKRWSVAAYILLAGISQVALLAAGIWSIAALVFPGIVIVIGSSNYRLMD